MVNSSTVDITIQSYRLLQTYQREINEFALVKQVVGEDPPDGVSSVNCFLQPVSLPFW
jgi:hypothetical protein